MSLPSRRKTGCGLTHDRDKRIAGRAAANPRHALPFEPDDLLVANASGDRNVERLAVRHVDTLLETIDGFEKVDWKRVIHIGAAHAELGASAIAASGSLAEQVPEEVAKIAQVLGSLVAGARSGFGVVAIEPALGLGLARLVDLASIERAALFGIVQECVRGGDVLEPVSASLSPGFRSGRRFFASFL